MPALQIIALDTTTPQLRAPASGDTYSAPRAIAMTPETLTGSSATSALSIAQTWNTTGTPTALQLNLTDTASNAASLLMDLRRGGVSQFNITKFGEVTSANFVAASEFRAGNSYAISGDVILRRDAANTLALRNGVNAQAFNIYNTFTDASNYERGSLGWSSNFFDINSNAAGTGTARSIRIRAGSSTWTFDTNGSTTLPANALTFAGGFTLGRASGVLTLSSENQLSGATFEMREQTAPAAPAADRVRIYAEDNGSGKTRLMALFATGAAQQIAIEP